MTNIFADATRYKIRFETAQGFLNTEDLWDLPLKTNHRRFVVDLDSIAIGLHQQLQEQNNISFVDDVPKEDEIIQLKFEVVKYVIEAKELAQKEAQEQVSKAARKAKLLEILARKQDAALEAVPMEELERMVSEL